MLKSVKPVCLLLMAALFILAQSGSALSATSAGIALLDANRALQETNAFKRAQAEIRQKAESLEAELRKLGEEIQKLQQDYQTQAAMLTPEAKAQKEQDLQAKMQNFAARRSAIQNEIAGTEKAAMEPIINKMEAVLKTLAQQKHYSLVMELRLVPYHDSSVPDITNDVIKAFNQANP
jgi:outer membrane protein